MKPRIIITGVSGRIGTRAAELFSNDYDIIGLDTVPYQGKVPITFISIDLSSDLSVHEAFKQIPAGPIASVLHLAAYYNFAGGEWEKYEQITISGTRRLIEALKNFEVEQFIFSSTLLVYASCKKEERITELSPVDPKWEYPLSKVETEKFLQPLQDQIKIVILRIAGIYDDFCNSIPISQQIMRIDRKELESHFYPGKMDHGQPFLHMDDFLSACQIVVDKRKDLPNFSLFNLGEDKTFAYEEMQEEIGRLLHGKPWKTYPIPKWIAKAGTWAREYLPFLKKSFIKPWMIDLSDDHQELDISEPRKVLGWEPAHSVIKTLPSMIEALKKDPKHWTHCHKLIK